MNNDNQFNFEEDISINNNTGKTPSPEEMRKKLIPLLVAVLVLLVIAIVFACFFFSPNRFDNKDDLICVESTDNYTITMTYHYEDDKLENIKRETVYNFSKEIIEQYRNNNNDMCDNYNGQKEVYSCKQIIKDDSIVLKVTYNIDEVKDDIKNASIDELEKKMINEVDYDACAINKVPNISKKDKKGTSETKDNEDEILRVIDTFMAAVITSVNNNEFGPLSNDNYIYYIKVNYDDNDSCVSFEPNSINSSFDWDNAYVAVHYDPNTYSFKYYFTYFSSDGYGMPLTERDSIDKSMITKKHNLTKSNITTQIKSNAGEIYTNKWNLVQPKLISKGTNCSSN